MTWNQHSPCLQALWEETLYPFPGQENNSNLSDRMGLLPLSMCYLLLQTCKQAGGWWFWFQLFFLDSLDWFGTRLMGRGQADLIPNISSPLHSLQSVALSVQPSWFCMPSFIYHLPVSYPFCLPDTCLPPPYYLLPLPCCFLHLPCHDIPHFPNPISPLPHCVPMLLYLSPMLHLCTAFPSLPRLMLLLCCYWRPVCLVLHFPPPTSHFLQYHCRSLAALQTLPICVHPPSSLSFSAPCTSYPTAFL